MTTVNIHLVISSPRLTVTKQNISEEAESSFQTQIKDLKEELARANVCTLQITTVLITDEGHFTDTFPGPGEAVPIRVLPYGWCYTSHWHASPLEFIRPAYIERKARTQCVVRTTTKEREFPPMSSDWRRAEGCVYLYHSLVTSYIGRVKSSRDALIFYFQVCTIFRSWRCHITYPFDNADHYTITEDAFVRCMIRSI